jgi:hypothetical protein
MNYQSELTAPSEQQPGVTYRLARISLGKRIQILQRMRDLARKAGFLAAGEEVRDQIDAALVEKEIDVLYLRSGLLEVGGLTINGQEPSVEQFIQEGPESLTTEALRLVKQQFGLDAEERKN